MNKYRSKKILAEDGTFDSKKEYKRWLELKALAERGEIENLQRQVPFDLLPSQRIDMKVVERPAKYIADFVYTYKGTKVVEDTKGFKTPDYILKRKMMLYFHGIKINEV